MIETMRMFLAIHEAKLPISIAHPEAQMGLAVIVHPTIRGAKLQPGSLALVNSYFSISCKPMR